eukprot:g40115.t1
MTYLLAQMFASNLAALLVTRLEASAEEDCHARQGLPAGPLEYLDAEDEEDLLMGIRLPRRDKTSTQGDHHTARMPCWAKTTNLLLQPL